MSNTLWSRYVQTISGDDDQATIASRISKTQATVSRWLSGKTSPDEGALVAKFARAYGRNPLEAFVAAGMLEEDEAGRGLTKKSRDLLGQLREEEAARAAMRAELERREERSRRRSLG